MPWMSTLDKSSTWTSASIPGSASESAGVSDLIGEFVSDKKSFKISSRLTIKANSEESVAIFKKKNLFN